MLKRAREKVGRTDVRKRVRGLSAISAVAPREKELISSAQPRSDRLSELQDLPLLKVAGRMLKFDEKP